MGRPPRARAAGKAKTWGWIRSMKKNTPAPCAYPQVLLDEFEAGATLMVTMATTKAQTS